MVTGGGGLSVTPYLHFLSGQDVASGPVNVCVLLELTDSGTQVVLLTSGLGESLLAETEM